MNITTDMLKALEDQITMLQVMILNSVNDDVSTAKFQKQKTQLVLLLKECSRTKINENIYEIDIHQKIDIETIDSALNRLRHKHEFSIRFRNIIRLMDYDKYTWKEFYILYYNNQKRLIDDFQFVGPKTAKIIISILDELGIPDLIEGSIVIDNTKKLLSFFFISIISLQFFLFSHLGLGGFYIGFFLMYHLGVYGNQMI